MTQDKFLSLPVNAPEAIKLLHEIYTICQNLRIHPPKDSRKINGFFGPFTHYEYIDDGSVMDSCIVQHDALDLSVSKIESFLQNRTESKLALSVIDLPDLPDHIKKQAQEVLLGGTL